jgi:hypothetical protein
MNVRNDRSVDKRQTKAPGKARSAKPRVRNIDRELADQRLDEALRHTFPASDALSIIQVGGGS